MSIEATCITFQSYRKFLFLLIYGLTILSAQAQPECPIGNSGIGEFYIYTYPNPAPTAIDTVIRICIGQTIYLAKKAPDRGEYIHNVNYDFDDNNGPLPITADSSHTYDAPGKYTIVQRGSGNGVNCISRRKEIIVLAKPEPQFILTTCTAQRVLLTLPKNDPNNVYDEYEVDWGDGTRSIVSAAQSTASHSYASTGNYTVTVQGRYQPEACGSASSQTVTPVPTLEIPTWTQLTVKDDATVELLLSPTTDYVTYQIDQRVPSGNYQQVQTLDFQAASQPVILSGLNTKNNIYCFKVTAFDACGNPLTIGEACTENLKVSAQNRQNQVQWSASTVGNPQYQLFRNDSQLAATQATPFIDTDIKCSRQYCYRLEAETGTIRSVSQPVCVTAISDEQPSPVENLTAMVQPNEQIQLIWKKPDQYAVRTYTIHRSENGSPFKSYTQLTGLADQFVDTALSNDSVQYCYQVSYTDSCGNVSGLSSVACPVRLKAMGSETNIRLNWNAYLGWPSGVSGYVVEKLDAQRNVIQSSNVGSSLSYSGEDLDTIHQVIYFRVKVISNDAVPLESYSNLLEYRQEMRIFLPDAFTPNNDGLNDTYLVRGVFIKNFKMQVTNRWGELLFESDSVDKGWDGTYQGKAAPAGNYVCRIEVEDSIKKIIRKNKIFVLLK